MAEIKLYYSLSQQFPRKADLERWRSEKWTGKSTEETELLYWDLQAVKNCFPKESRRMKEERKKMGKDDRSMVLYKERLNRLRAVFLEKEMIKEVYRSQVEYRNWTENAYSPFQKLGGIS